MFKRILLLLVALLLLAGAAAGVFWFLNARNGEATPGGGTAESGDGFPASGERAASPANEPSSAETLSLACPERWEGLPDSDQDGLPDPAEALYRTDEATADTDGDGFSDSAEVRAGYDPAKKEGNPRLDSDGDGLLDGDECRWKTDPFVTDTDGDGFEDGAEVANKFDPALKGDGQGSDALPERRAEAARVTLEQFRPRADSENLTERLAARILGDRSSAEAANLVITPQDIERALASLNLSPNTTLPEVPISELTPSNQNTPRDLQTYLSDIDRLRPRELTDVAVFAQAVGTAANGDPSMLRGIRGQLATYESDLRSVVTPPTAVPHHRTLIGLTRFVIERFSTVETTAVTDPVRVHMALRELQEGAKTHTETLVRLRGELEQLARAP